MGVVFRELAPKDLHAHFRYIASGNIASNRAELLLGDVPIEIPVLRRTFKRKSDQLGLLLRSGSLGRPALETIYEFLGRSGHSLWVRRSAKRKQVSQCMPFWPVSGGTYPAEAVAILRVVCDTLGMSWPPTISLAYVDPKVDGSLPGEQVRGAAWKVGFALGRIANRVIGGN